MPDVPDIDHDNLRENEEEVKEKTINDPIAYPDQASLCVTESFMERKDDIDCEDGADPHIVASPEEDLSASIDQNLFAKQAEVSPPQVEQDSQDSKHTADIDDAKHTEDIKKASFLWSPRLLLAISIVLVSCCSNVIFLELLVRQVF